METIAPPGGAGNCFGSLLHRYLASSQQSSHSMQTGISTLTASRKASSWSVCSNISFGKQVCMSLYSRAKPGIAENKCPMTELYCQGDRRLNHKRDDLADMTATVWYRVFVLSAIISILVILCSCVTLDCGLYEEAREGAQHNLTCRGLKAGGTVRWTKTSDVHGDIAIANCTGIAACFNNYPAQYKVMRSDDMTSQLTILGVSRDQTFVEGVWKCSSTSETEYCSVRTVYPPDIGQCQVRFDNARTEVIGDCEMMKVFPQPTCDWFEQIQGRNETRIPSTNARTTSTHYVNSAGQTYFRATCNLQLRLPTTEGAYSYLVQITPGHKMYNVSFTSTNVVRSPAQPQLLGCPDTYVIDADVASCVCSTSDLGSPRGSLAWRDPDGNIFLETLTLSLTLRFADVAPQYNGKPHRCTLNHYLQSKEVEYTPKIAAKYEADMHSADLVTSRLSFSSEGSDGKVVCTRFSENSIYKTQNVTVTLKIRAGAGSSPTQESSNLLVILSVVGGVGAGVFVLLIIAAVIYIRKRNPSRRTRLDPDTDTDSEGQPENSQSLPHSAGGSENCHNRDTSMGAQPAAGASNIEMKDMSEAMKNAVTSSRGSSDQETRYTEFPSKPSGMKKSAGETGYCSAEIGNAATFSGGPDDWKDDIRPEEWQKAWAKPHGYNSDIGDRTDNFWRNGGFLYTDDNDDTHYTVEDDSQDVEQRKGLSHSPLQFTQWENPEPAVPHSGSKRDSPSIAAPHRKETGDTEVAGKSLPDKTEDYSAEAQSSSRQSGQRADRKEESEEHLYDVIQGERQPRTIEQVKGQGQDCDGGDPTDVGGNDAFAGEGCSDDIERKEVTDWSWDSLQI